MEEIKESFSIPDKFRKVGNPYGQYILYIEDYVHTFMKQYLKIKQKGITIAAYGKICENDDHFYIFITAACMNIMDEKEMFPQQEYIGNIEITGKGKEKKDNTWKLELSLLGDIKATLDSYYIFYDKNEIMQNYLISWHEQNHNPYIMEQPEMTVKYARALQDCAHFESKGNRQRQIFSIISFAFLILLSVMLITIMNNYKKMVELQDNMAYIMEHMDEFSEEELIQRVEGYIEKNGAIETISNQNVEKKASVIIEETQENEEETNQENNSQIVEKKQTEETTEQKTEKDVEEETDTESEKSTIQESSEDAGNEVIQEKRDEDVPINEKELQSSATTNDEITITYQVYTVKVGDTLRKIIWNQYHSLDRLTEISNINQIQNPDEIVVGQKIYLP